MNFYKSDEHFLAWGLLLANVLASAVFGYEKPHFGFVVLNPILFLIPGFLIWLRRRAYIPSNLISYSVVEGNPAGFLGVCLMILGALSLLAYNVNFIPQSSLGVALFIQMAVSVALCVGTALAKGEMLYRS